jgi:hypothetical protein
MEDLKKQTAIRLANEPENPEFHRHPNERNMQIHDLKRQTALRLAKEQGQSRATGEGGMQILPPEQMQYQPVYLPPPPAFTPVDPNRVAHDSRIFDGPVPMENRSFSRHEGQCMVDPNLSNQMQYPQSRNNVTSMPNQQSGAGRGSPTRISRPNRPGSSLSTESANSFGSGGERKGGGKTMPKLPHGLTVQELKEMTKARLQAEATESSLDSDEQPPNVALPQQPYGRGAGEAVSPLGFVHEQGRPSPFAGRISPHTPTTPVLREGFTHTPQQRETWHQTSGMDGWDTGSVASSEYLSSESPYSSSFQQQQDDYPGVAFSRSRSYGAGGYEQPESRSPYLASGSPFAEVGPGQNRRRASTLSPRPGPGLTYLHEDRPLAYTLNSAALPSFDSAIKPRPRIRHENSDTFNYESSSLNSSPARVWTTQTGAIGGCISNRPRTASAPTVRPVSQPSDQFSAARANDPLARLPSTHSLGVTADTSGEFNNAFDSALGISTGARDKNGERDDLDAVFRQPTGVQRPPPGLFPTAESTAPGLFGSRSNDFGWDGGWNKSAIGSRNQEYQSRARSHTDGEALLADSLGSMLSLSVPAPEQATRHPSLGNNTFVSRIDPEVDFNRRRAATSSPLSPSLHGALAAPNSSIFEHGGTFQNDAFRGDKPSYM